MKMTDGKKIVEITMKVWNDFLDSYGPDFSYVFFDAALEWEAENEDNQLFWDVI